MPMWCVNKILVLPPWIQEESWTENFKTRHLICMSICTCDYTPTSNKKWILDRTRYAWKVFHATQWEFPREGAGWLGISQKNKTEVNTDRKIVVAFSVARGRVVKRTSMPENKRPHRNTNVHAGIRMPVSCKIKGKHQMTQYRRKKKKTKKGLDKITAGENCRFVPVRECENMNRIQLLDWI